MHRDLKAENILVKDMSDDTDLCIADLGSATKLKAHDDHVTLRIGTAGYIAPEILLMKPFSLPADIWSLGCVLHFLATARLPFWDDDRNVRAAKTCNEKLKMNFLSGLSSEG